MTQAERRSIIALPVVLLVAAGLAFAGSQGGTTIGRIPLFTLGIALAFIIQWIAFIPSFLNKTEAFYDLTGGITYLTVMVVAVLLSPTVDTRGYLLLAMVAVWAIRLSTFLFRRVRAAGEDTRFREIKVSFPRFLVAWSIQGLWVSFSLAAALAAITSEIKVPFGIIGAIGFLVWLVGFSIEVVADRQKSQFRAKPENKGRFITSGLWSWSRHPNYFGEIVLWIGVAIIAAPVLRGWQWATMISPIFIILLLTRISGVNLLEKQADERWGGEEDYEAYKARTSVLVLKPPAGS